jgi:NAD+ kinase
MEALYCKRQLFEYNELTLRLNICQMKIAVYSRGIEYNQMLDLKLFISTLEKHNVEPVFFQDFFNQIYSAIEMPNQYSTFTQEQGLDDTISCIISLGGDGTLLDVVTFVKDSGIPILGINYGRLGFLATTSNDELETALEAIAARNYSSEKRTLLHVESNIPTFGDVPFALNEFTLHKKDTSPMIKIHTYLNGEFLNTYWADGLIVATPTGSTGYSLSCNGPVLFPEAASFIITAIAPHNLNTRPVIVSDNTIISFEVEGRTEDCICTLDSRKYIVPKEIQLAVKKESFTINLVRLNENNFLNTLRTKLNWGLDKRN